MRHRASGLLCLLFFGALALLVQPPAYAQVGDPADQICPRYPPGSALPAPADLYSQNHALEVTLRLQTVTDAQARTRYCYTTPAGDQAPTLHLWPGDQLTVHLLNALPGTGPAGTTAGGDCVAAPMGPATTNLHFHGMNLPPTCHQDDVVGVLVQPQASFDYILQIAADEPPGLYWYHPHPHGFSEAQVLGGAAGAIIIEGIESVVPQVAGLPQRVWVVRDQLRAVPWGGAHGEPILDLSVNFVPVAYPDYTPPVLQSAPASRELWRVLNASADEILDLQYLVGTVPQPLEIVGIDGIPVGQGTGTIQAVTDTHFLLPAGARVEFIVTTPPTGAAGELVTRQVDAGRGALPYPARPLALISPTGTGQALALPRRLKAARPRQLRFARLGTTSPDAVRRLFFSEGELYPGHAAYFITLEGHTPKIYDMSAPPDLVLHQGTVEDWTVENRSNEDHVFHIHQLHFQVLAVNGVAIADPSLRDTLNVPHWSGSGPYPSVTLRMDFRDPAIVGSFVYHCHLLAHEDAGMMAGLKLLPAGTATATTLTASRLSVNVNGPLTLTATVAPAVSGAPVNGTVQFAVDGGALAGAVPVSGGQAILSTSFGASGAHTVTAAYSGDADCNESLSADLPLSIEDFSLSAQAIALRAGASGISTVTLSGTPGFDSAVTLACAVPDSLTGAHCELTPASLTGSGNVQLRVSTTGARAATGTLGGAMLAGVGLVIARARKRTPRERGRPFGARLVWLLPLLALGCSGSGSSLKGTPPGAYQVTVTATAVQGTGQLRHQLTVPVEVH